MKWQVLFIGTWFLIFGWVMPAHAWKMESAQVTLTDTTVTPAFTSVSFRQTYDLVPLVFALPTNEGSESSALRIRNVTTTGFEIAQVEPPGNDGRHASMTIHYLAIEPGTKILPDGTIIEAGSISTTTVQHGSGVGGGEGWDTVNFSTAFSTTPAVLAHIQGMVNESNNPPTTTSIPWLTTAVRNVSSSSVELALERSEVNDGGGAVSSNETIAYLAVNSGLTGTFTDSGSSTIAYETIRSADNILGWDNGCYTTSFSGSYSAAPLVIANENTHDGGDGGWMRRCSLSTASVGLTEDEDTDRDSERAHTTERAGILVFSQAFDADFPDPTPVGYYPLDETSWNGTAGEVLDGSGNANHGVAVTGAQTVADGTVCRAGATDSEGEAINTSVDVDGAVGNRGTVTFWFRPNWSQSGGERNQARVIFDASFGDKYFKLAKLDNQNNFYPDNGARRRLALLFKDSADGDFVAYTGSEISFSSGTWIHLAVTWDFPGDRFQIYVDGALAANQSINTNGSIPALDTLYLGDTRSGYNPYGVTTMANGSFDEVRIWNTVRSQLDIQNDMNATHACSTLNHYSISHSGTGVNCQAEPVTFTAHDGSHSPFTLSGATTITLSTSTGLGDWALTTGLGTLNNGTANDGIATYQFGNESSVALTLKHTTPAPSPGLSINVTDGTVTEISGAATAADDPSLIFAPSGFRYTDGTNPVTIGTQISGKESNVAPGAQSLYLQAIRTDTSTGACVGVFPSGTTVNVEMASQCNNPIACVAGKQVSITNNSITTAIASNPNAGVGSYTSVPLLFGANSQALFSFIYPDAGRISLHARYNIPLEGGGASPDNMLGSSNTFVERPFGFRITDPPSGRTGSGSTVFTTAGTSFNTTLTAVVWESADDADNDGVPDSQGALAANTATPNFGQETTAATATLSHTLAEPAGGASGTLTVTAPGFTGFANGAKTQTVSFSEVGIVSLLATSSDYLSGGQDITAGANGLTGVGRFTPHHFDVTKIDGCTGGATFTYSGQPFAMVTATARNLAGVTTTNYRDFGGGLVFSKDTTISNAGDTTNFTNNVIAASSFALGIGNQTTVTYTFPPLPNPPGKDVVPLTLTLRAIDTDSVSSAGYTEDTAEIRSGRVNIINAYGSELADLPLPMRVEYYSADGWVTNTSDTCTSVPATSLSLSNNTAPTPVSPPTAKTVGTQTTSATVANSPFVSGDAGLSFSAPGAGGEGYVDVTPDLSTSIWLRYDWDGDSTEDNPAGRATFGLYRGSPRHIYQRERY